MRPLDKRKFVAGIVSAAGAAVLALASLTAGAYAAPNPGPPASENAGLGYENNPDGPQTANVPYVAWIGEHVRLVACDPAINQDDYDGELKNKVKGDEVEGGDPELQFVNYQLEDWSGYQYQPPNADGQEGNNYFEAFEPGPAAFFQSEEPAHEGDGCVATTYKSLNPGLARIRVDVRSYYTDKIVFTDQFLVIWMTVNKPTISEAGLTASGSEVFQDELTPQGKSNLAGYLGDAKESGVFTPSPFSEPEGNTDKGLIQVKVTGSFPVVKESPLSNILSEPSYTLPEAWPTLAKTLADSSEENEEPGSNPGLWDIHGTPGDDPGSENPNGYEETAVDSSGEASKVCTTGFGGPFSSTDNCNGKAGEEPMESAFSRLYGDLTSGYTSTVGPYDPQIANQTLLSDGRLNEDDAPMPAMRIDVSIAKNEGGIEGVGQIGSASKALIYSHNFNGQTTAHNLYDPYYGEYIPSTSRPISEASGVSGSEEDKSGFKGFLNDPYEPYEFWTSVLKANERGASESTGCLRREDSDPEYYKTPTGYLTETFYTDERGEAYVTYTPGDGFYLENLPKTVSEESGKLEINGNGGCDLKGLYGDEIGRSVITAKALYPYEPVDYKAETSETLTKKVISEWEKELFEFPKQGDKDARIVVAKAQDIDGSPFVGEVVCFHAEQNSAIYTENKLGDLPDPEEQLHEGPSVNLTGSVVEDPADEGSEHLCETTNSYGLAGIEVVNSTYGKVDVHGRFEEERIERDKFIEFPENAGGKAEKEAKEAEKKAAEKRFAEEQEAKEKQREKEVAEAKITKEQAEREAAEEKKRHEEELSKLVVPAPTTTTTTTTTGTSLIAPLGTGGVLGVSSANTPKPLTEAQKLAAALKACRKLPKKKRVACEVKAKAAHSAKKRKKK
jgi:hypothetical protein